MFCAEIQHLPDGLSGGAALDWPSKYDRLLAPSFSTFIPQHGGGRPCSAVSDTTAEVKEN
jgi:hypothetical protein